MSETQTLTLSDFLLARIAEDETRARRVGSVDHPLDQASYFRVLAECEAKRRIVDECRAGMTEEWHTGYTCSAELGYGTILEALALPYADHPDYREEWRP